MKFVDAGAESTMRHLGTRKAFQSDEFPLLTQTERFRMNELFPLIQDILLNAAAA